MGIQCHVNLKDVYPKANEVRIHRIYEETGGGPNQDEPWNDYVCQIAFTGEPDFLHGKILLEADGHVKGFWFDANHWGGNRWQVDVLKKNNIPFVES